jgi:hypothetical protein
MQFDFNFIYWRAIKLHRTKVKSKLLSIDEIINVYVIMFIMINEG